MAQQLALWPRKQDECSNMVDDTIPPIRRDFYVYILFRPDGRPCYVGKGCGKRDKKHEKYGSHNPHLKAIIENAGGSLPAIRYRDGIQDTEAHSLERILIAAIGREIHGGPLVNQTDGGEGVSGVIRSPETIARMSAAQLGKRVSAEQRLNQCASHLLRYGRSLEDLGTPGFKLTAFQRKLLNKPALTRREQGDLLRERNIGNKHGVGNKRSADGQAMVTQSVIEANRRRNKSGNPTVHKGPQPWLDEGVSRTSWYRNRAAGKSNLKPPQPELELTQQAA